MYRNIKEKYRQFRSDGEYAALFNNFMNVIFKYDERIFRPEIMENLLHDMGVCALIETDTARYTPVICFLSGGERYADGLFSTAYCYDARGHEYKFEKWRTNENIIVIFNTPLITTDSWIDKNIMLLTDIDTSLTNNIIFSRQKPIPIARDKKTKTQIDTAINDLQNGKLTTVLAEFGVADLSNEQKPFNVLDLSDVTKSQYIQYLIHAYDAIFSRTCMLMGLDITDNGKQAQITTDELNRHEDVSLIMPLQWYKSRKDALSPFGLQFDFSDFMKQRFAKTESEVRKNEDAEKTDNDILSESDNNDTGESA